MVKIGIFNNILIFLMLIAGVLFFVGTGLNGNKWLWLSFFANFALLLVFDKFFIRRYDLSRYYTTAVTIILWIHMIGELWFYYHFVGTDKLMHFIASVLITMILYDYSKRKVDYFLIFLAVVGCLGTWEIFEFILYSNGFPVSGVIINGKQLLSPYEDTIRDIVWGAAGSLISLIFLYKKKGKEQLCQEQNK